VGDRRRGFSIVLVGNQIAESARMPIAFDALCACQQNVQF